MKGQRPKRGYGSKMEEGEWGGETGPNSWKRGGREYKKRRAEE